MLLIESWLNRLPCTLGVGLLCCVLLGGVADAQAPEQGVAGPAAPAPASTASPGAPVATAAPAEGSPAQPQEAAGTPLAADVAPGLLPRDLTPWGMFMAADIVVKAVMVGLIFASVLTWTIWLAKTLELVGARRSLARAQGVLAEARSLAEAAKSASLACRPVARLIAAVESELRRSPDRRDIDGIKERIAARFDARRHHREIGGMQLRDPDEAVNDAPHRAEQADEGRGRTDGGEDAGAAQHLPADERIEAGAEALLATAFGLAAAIPAVVIYNMFSRSIAQYRALYADTSVEILTMVSRDLVQRYPAAAPAAE